MHSVKYFYKIIRKTPESMKKDPDAARDYVTRGEVIDAFEKIEQDIPRLRKRLVEIPVFSPIYTMPASPI
jgi:hypothetical protein